MNRINDDWTAIIPARSGSKGLKNKNIRKLAGLPLYVHSVNLAKKAGAKNIFISTDIDEIISKKNIYDTSVKVIERDGRLCEDDALMEDVILNLIDLENIIGRIVLLQPTSPLRIVSDIRECINLHKTKKCDLVFSVVKQDSSILKYGFLDNGIFKSISKDNYCFSNRQNLPNVYKPNGAVYVFNAEDFIRIRGFPKENIVAYEMPTSRSIDIDGIRDLNYCEKILKKGF